MSFPVHLPYVLCLKCGPNMRSCKIATRDACRYPKVYFSDKKSYKAEKERWDAAEKKTKRACEFSEEGSWECFEDEWMD